MKNPARWFATLILFSNSAAAQDPLELIKKVSVGSRGLSREEWQADGMLIIFDGQFRWNYNRERNEYTKEIARMLSGPGAALSIFVTAAHRMKSARLLRQETLELASGPVNCQVIEVAENPRDDRMQFSPKTYWIDASRNLVLKLHYKLTIDDPGRPSPSESITTISFTKASVGEPVEEALFRFEPPKDAVQVDRIVFGPKSSMVGKEVPDFELKGLDGATITGASLLGSVVLFQFGRDGEDQMLPFLELARRSLKGNGLRVIFILAEDNRRDVPSQLYQVEVAFDQGGRAARKFAIGHTGSVLIDRNGKIVSVDTLSNNTRELAGALRKTGVW